MSKFNLVKHNGNAIPATDADMKKFGKVGEGEVFSCKTIDQRNYKLLQKYWVLMNFGFEHKHEKYDGYWVTPEDFEEEVLIAIGWKRMRKDFHGNETAKAKSISYENCPEEEVFQQIYNRCLDFMFRFLEVEENSTMMDELMSFT